jgi:acyl carrier protein
MKPMSKLIGSHPVHLLAGIADAIKTVSPKSREVPILPASLLLEDLALDSLDLVAVILEVQDRFHVEIDPDEIPNLRSVEDLLIAVTHQLQTAA